MIDMFLTYSFLKRLTTPFEKWRAFRAGVIDDEGNILKSKKDRTKAERASFTKYDLMILKLKKLLEKFPEGRRRIGSYAAAAWLLKEGNARSDEAEFITEVELLEGVQSMMELIEDAPVNNVGSGNIAGTGIGPDGEPHVKQTKMIRRKKRDESEELTEETYSQSRILDIINYVPLSRAGKFEEVVNELFKALEQGKIYNARYEEYKSIINNTLNRTFNNLEKQFSDRVQGNFDVWYFYGMSDLKKVQKAWQKDLNRQPTEVKRVLDGIQELVDVFNKLKPMIIKGREPKPVDPKAFVKPMPKAAAVRQAKAYLEMIVSSFKDNLITSIDKEINAKVNILRKKSITLKDFGDPLVGKIYTSKVSNGIRSFALRDDWQSVVQKEINYQVDEIIDGFLTKGVNKLSLIFEKKENVVSHKLLHTNVRNGLIENSMMFVFSDNSSFVIRSSVIYKTSIGGKFFLQYPTRFTDVVMADGSKMISPSEEKMIKEF